MKAKWIRAAFLVLLSVALLLGSVGCATETEPNDSAGDTTPPAISGVGSSSVTPSGAAISWSTDELATSQVEYGVTASYGSSSVLDSSLVATHSVTLTGLNAAATYHYRVRSQDGSQNEATSADYAFTTAAPSDTTAPVISSVAAAATTSGANITWIADEAATSQVEYGLTTSYGLTSTLNTSLVTNHSVVLSGLSAGTYHYRVKSKDASNNEAVSGDNTFTTATPSDTFPPVISSVASIALTVSMATITWDTDEVSTSQVEYGQTSAYGAATNLDTNLVTGHSVALTSLTAGTTYHFRVRSEDAAGNEATSGDGTFTTATPSDTFPPVISDVTISGVSASGVTVNWTTDEPATGQVEYGLTASYGSASALDTALHATHILSLSGLLGGTTYHFRVRSKDATGNESVSQDDTFTTSTTGSRVEITYIFYDGMVPTVESDEYVEIENLGGIAQDITGWVLKDVSDGSPSFTFQSYVLQPGETIRVYTNEIHPEWGSFSFGSGTPVWNNSEPDTAALFDAEGHEISRKSY